MIPLSWLFFSRQNRIELDSTSSILLRMAVDVCQRTRSIQKPGKYAREGDRGWGRIRGFVSLTMHHCEMESGLWTFFLSTCVILY